MIEAREVPMPYEVAHIVAKLKRAIDECLLNAPRGLPEYVPGAPDPARLGGDEP